MNARQTRFVQEYLIDPNATRAARRSGYSAKSARFIGAENLTKLNIAAAIATAQAERAERLRVTADEVMLQLRKYGFSSMRDYFDEEGRLLEPQELTPDAAVGLSAVKVLREHTRIDGEAKVVEQVIEVRRRDPLRALELLGRHLGMFKDKVNIGADVSLLDALRRIEAREDEEAIRGAK